MQFPDVWVEMCHSLHFIVVATDRVRVAGGGPQRGQVHHVAAVPPLAVEVVAVLQEVDVEVNWKVIYHYHYYRHYYHYHYDDHLSS